MVELHLTEAGRQDVRTDTLLALLGSVAGLAIGETPLSFMTRKNWDPATRRPVSAMLGAAIVVGLARFGERVGWWDIYRTTSEIFGKSEP